MKKFRHKKKEFATPMKLEVAFTTTIKILSTAVHASGLMSLGPGDLTRLLTLGSLPEKKLEKEVRRIFFEGRRKMLSKEIVNKEFLKLRELFSLRRVLNRVGEGRLPGDVAIIAMLVTDGGVQMKYADAFEWSLAARCGEELLKVLMEEMGTNSIYASIQSATVASVVELDYHNAGGVIAGQCIDSRYWDTPGRWRRVFETMLNTRAIREGILYEDAYDKELLGVLRRAELADLFCEYILKYDEHDGVVARNTGFMELRITNEILNDRLYSSVLFEIVVRYPETFSNLEKKSGGSPERVLSDLIAEGYWLCLKGSKLDELILRLPEGHDVFRKICERYSSEMRGIDRRGLSIEGLKAMAKEGNLDELVKDLIGRLVRCANKTDLESLRNTEPRIEELFRKLLESGELKEDMRRGFKKAIKYCCHASYVFTYFRKNLGIHKMSRELSKSGEFDEEIKGVFGAAIKKADAGLLKWSLRNMPSAKRLLKKLLRTVPKARELARKLLSTKEFDEMTRECKKRPTEKHPARNPRSAKKMRIA